MLFRRLEGHSLSRGRQAAEEKGHPNFFLIPAEPQFRARHAERSSPALQVVDEVAERVDGWVRGVNVYHAVDMVVATLLEGEREFCLADGDGLIGCRNLLKELNRAQRPYKIHTRPIVQIIP